MLNVYSQINQINTSTNFQLLTKIYYNHHVYSAKLNKSNKY